jgi:hypothetical protein
MYWCYLLLDYQGGFDRLFGIIIFQPFISVAIAIITILIAVIVGLPFRLLNSLAVWWKHNFMFPIIVAIIGIVLFVVSLFVYTEVLIPYVWFITAFGIMHLIPPTILKRFDDIALSSRNNS